MFFFVQLYFYDPVIVTTFRLCQHPDFWYFFFEKLDTMIRSCGNLFINIYTTAQEQIDRARIITFFMQIVLNPRFCNVPML